jgi:hypothetical protein
VFAVLNRRHRDGGLWSGTATFTESILGLGIMIALTRISAFAFSILDLLRGAFIWSTALKTSLVCAHAATEGAQYAIE